MSRVQYFFLHLLLFLGHWISYSPLICYSNIIFIFFLSTGTMRSVSITLTNQILRHASVISLRLFGPTAGNLGLVTPLERTPNFQDMYASMLLDDTNPLATTWDHKDWKRMSNEAISTTLTALQGPKHQPLL